MDTFEIRTFGCQMNKHDAERVAGLLRSVGLVAHDASNNARHPDVIVFLTCCVRENADERLTGQVASLKSLKATSPEALIAIGGCIGQRDRERLLQSLPHVDVIFGTHNVSRLPELLRQARESRTAAVEVVESSSEFTSDLPAEREHPWHAWIPITVGCDNFCSYCIVPYVRGRERSRTLEDISEEAARLVSDGVLEITLLGQNVNSYGRDLYGHPRFPDVLRAVAGSGVKRIRFATSHPKDLSEETIAVMRDESRVCRALHLPVQSGSDRILRAMNRHYTSAEYRALVDRLYEAMPDLALSTDIIVGFPGESEEDFLDTMRMVEHARYDQAFTFIYSRREGTPAADMPDRVPREVAQDRFDRLVAAIQSSAARKNASLVGSMQRILVQGISKRDASMLAGRTEGGKVVHVPIPPGTDARQWEGRFADVCIREAHTWFLRGRLTG